MKKTFGDNNYNVYFSILIALYKIIVLNVKEIKQRICSTVSFM